MGSTFVHIRLSPGEAFAVGNAIRTLRAEHKEQNMRGYPTGRLPELHGNDLLMVTDAYTRTEFLNELEDSVRSSLFGYLAGRRIRHDLDLPPHA